MKNKNLSNGIIASALLLGTLLPRIGVGDDERRERAEKFRHDVSVTSRGNFVTETFDGFLVAGKQAVKDHARENFDGVLLRYDADGKNPRDEVFGSIEDDSAIYAHEQRVDNAMVGYAAFGNTTGPRINPYAWMRLFTADGRIRNRPKIDFDDYDYAAIKAVYFHPPRSRNDDEGEKPERNKEDEKGYYLFTGSVTASDCKQTPDGFRHRSIWLAKITPDGEKMLLDIHLDAQGASYEGQYVTEREDGTIQLIVNHLEPRNQFEPGEDEYALGIWLFTLDKRGQEKRKPVRIGPGNAKASAVTRTRNGDLVVAYHVKGSNHFHVHRIAPDGATLHTYTYDADPENGKGILGITESRYPKNGNGELLLTGYKNHFVPRKYGNRTVFKSISRLWILRMAAKLTLKSKFELEQPSELREEFGRRILETEDRRVVVLGEYQDWTWRNEYREKEEYVDGKGPHMFLMKLDPFRSER